MIEFVLRFNEPVNVLIFLLMFLSAALYVYRRWKKGGAVTLAPFIGFNFTLLLIWMAFWRIDHDETVHLHLSWLVAQGLIPFRDFWQHHPPFFWVVLAPLLKLAPVSAVVFDYSRIFAGMVFLVNACLGWQIAKQCWREKAKISVYLLILSSSAIVFEYSLLRPDIFIACLMLCGILISFGIVSGRILPCLISGIAFGLAASLLPKQYLMYILPVIAVFISGKPRRLFKTAVYIFGFFIGCLPLLAYLFSQQILQDYSYWVIQFNKRVVIASVFFPLAIGLLGTWGAYLLFRRAKELRDKHSAIVLCAFLLSGLSSLTRAYGGHAEYNLAFWSYLAAITASGCIFPQVLERIRSLPARVITAALIFSALIVPGLSKTWSITSSRYNYPQDKKSIALLMKYCSAGDPCLVLPPMHPVFAYDATRISTSWQFTYTASYLSVRKDTREGGIAQRLLVSRPAVISYRYHGKDLFLEMFQNRLISADDYARLVKFLRKDYIQREIGAEDYHIRRDLAAKYQDVPLK